MHLSCPFGDSTLVHKTAVDCNQMLIFTVTEDGKTWTFLMFLYQVKLTYLGAFEVRRLTVPSQFMDRHNYFI